MWLFGDSVSMLIKTNVWLAFFDSAFNQSCHDVMLELWGSTKGGVF